MFLKSTNVLKIGLIGLMVSFLGTLPLGTLNLAAFQLSITVGVEAALLFSFGALLVEMIYVWITLRAIAFFQLHQCVLKLANCIALIVMVVFALNDFRIAFRGEFSAMNSLSNGGVITSYIPFLSGMIMSALNPMQIPFWLGWSQVLYDRQILKKSNKIYFFYILGIGSGTFLGNSVFIFGGHWALSNLDTSQKSLHFILGLIFSMLAVVQVIRLVKQKKMR